MPAHELWSKNGKVAKVLLKQYINTTDLVGWLRSCWIWHVCRSLSKQSNSINRNIFLFSIGFPLAHCKVETNGLSLNQYDSLITVTLSCRIGTSKKNWRNETDIFWDIPILLTCKPDTCTAWYTWPSTKSPLGFRLDFDPSGFAAMGAFFSALPESNPERHDLHGLMIERQVVKIVA